MSAEQSSLSEFGIGPRDLSDLTNAEREAWVAIERGGQGVREFARETDRAPGTVGNLLARAREKLDVEDGGAR